MDPVENESQIECIADNGVGAPDYSTANLAIYEGKMSTYLKLNFDNTSKIYF